MPNNPVRYLGISLVFLFAPWEPGNWRVLMEQAFEFSHKVSQGFFCSGPQIKNPEQPAPPSTGLGRKRRALFPAHLQAKFGSRRFVPADPPDFLNYEGAEFILIPASSAAIEPELGVEIETSDSVNKNDDDLIEILGLSKDSKRIRPLIDGVWA